MWRKMDYSNFRGLSSSTKRQSDHQFDHNSSEDRFSSKDGYRHPIFDKILDERSSYLGSSENQTETPWIYDETENRMIKKRITYNPALLILFDHILRNAAENKCRDQSTTMIKIDIDQKTGLISIWNNGRGIPVVRHNTEDKFIPELIYESIFISSNFEAGENCPLKLLAIPEDVFGCDGGENIVGGLGAKLVNLCSEYFKVETGSVTSGLKFMKKYYDNMTRCDQADISNCDQSDFTRITFIPDLKLLGLQKLGDGNLEMMHRRAVDIAGVVNGIKVIFNGKLAPARNFDQYVRLYQTGGANGESESRQRPIFVAESTQYVQVAVGFSDFDQFEQVCFVNGIFTSLGGTHVDLISDQIVRRLQQEITKRIDKQWLIVSPSKIKNQLRIFVSCAIPNPKFDSPTKSALITRPNELEPYLELNEKCLDDLCRSTVMDGICEWIGLKPKKPDPNELRALDEVDSDCDDGRLIMVTKEDTDGEDEDHWHTPSVDEDRRFNIKRPGPSRHYQNNRQSSIRKRHGASIIKERELPYVRPIEQPRRERIDEESNGTRKERWELERESILDCDYRTVFTKHV